MEFLRTFWLRFFRYDWKFGLFLILLFGIPRFILVLDANVKGGYSLAFVVFLLMWFTPLIFLTRYGRREIGLKRPDSFFRLLVSFLTGAVSCAVIFWLFLLIYGHSPGNAFVYISNTGGVPTDIPAADKFTYFIIAAIPSMIFSPIGEELFFRGVVHGSFVSRFGESGASLFDSLAFALTHLAHFGIVYMAGSWGYLFVPSLIWVISMFAVSQVFFRCKLFCHSIYGAVLSHAGFNFAMMYLIFYHL